MINLIAYVSTNQSTGILGVHLCQRICGALVRCDSDSKLTAAFRMGATHCADRHVSPRYFRNTCAGRAQLWTYAQALSDVGDIWGAL